MHKIRIAALSWIIPLLILNACRTYANAAPNPTQSASPVPTASSTPTAAPSETPTSAPLPAITPHPLSVEALRLGNYPGSNIVIETTLKPGANYNRYIVSYLSEGLKIYALMTIPNGEKPAAGWPVIIFNHGYIPPDQYVTTERYIAYVDLIARSGYIVFRSDYRGHGNSEGEALGAYSRPDYTIDVLNAVAAIKRYPDADMNRIGMWGHSMGGHITLRVMVASPDVKAGVIWAGVVGSYTDLMYNWHRGPGSSPDSKSLSGSWRLTLAEGYNSPEENPAFWDSISANSYLADISGPLQLHHGTNDEDVPLAFSENLFFQMLEAGQYVEFYKYQSDNHNISRYFSLAMQRTIEFFDRFVK